MPGVRIFRLRMELNFMVSDDLLSVLVRLLVWIGISGRKGEPGVEPDPRLSPGSSLLESCQLAPGLTAGMLVSHDAGEVAQVLTAPRVDRRVRRGIRGGEFGFRFGTK